TRLPTPGACSCSVPPGAKRNGEPRLCRRPSKPFRRWCAGQREPPKRLKTPGGGTRRDARFSHVDILAGEGQRAPDAEDPAVTAHQIIENILQALVAGVLVGSLYGLMCVGLALIFGVMRVINFAHGDFMMLGMYAAYYVFTALGIHVLFGNGFGPYVAAVLAGPLLFRSE